MTAGTVPSGRWPARILLAAIMCFAAMGIANADDQPPIEQVSLVMPMLPEPDIDPGIREGVAPTLVVRVDLSDQRMSVYLNGDLTNVFPVSTGRKGYSTPPGQYGPEWLSPYHRSKKYHNAPMPWAVFFHGGFAIHGTTEVGRLGRPASHGCVRLLTANAKTFFKLVQHYGKDNVIITVMQ